MSEDEAVDLAQQKSELPLNNNAQITDFKAFAKAVGYLPLAIDLAANQVRDGLSWSDLQLEFEAERQAVALEILDSFEEFEYLPLEEQRRYSLQACFNLSLLRLKEKKPKLLKQFAWLGILPEDVNLTISVAKVLWDIRKPIIVKRALIDLRQRSFLTDGVATIEGESTYRVHDLMHDLARNLIEDGILELRNLDSSRKSLQGITYSFPLAHCEFLERYQELATDGSWYSLPNDGYIHRYLTWHLEQGEWTEEIHSLLQREDSKGRNAWFEACEKIGQPAIFIEDVARGWRLAEKLYKQDKARAIGLQARYALITATLNSLVGNLPIGMMTECVKHNYWSVEQAWTYVEQMQDETKIVGAIRTLIHHFHLSKTLFQSAVDKVCEIQDEYRQASVLKELATLDGADFDKLLSIVRKIQDESKRASVLSELAKLDGAYFDEALSAARELQDEFRRASVLSELAKLDGAYFDEVLRSVHELQDEFRRAFVLRELAKLDGADFDKLLSAAHELQDKYNQADVLSDLAEHVYQDFLPKIKNAINNLTPKPLAAKSLSDSLICFPLEKLSYIDWQSFLNLLSYQKRSKLMQDFITLHPAILHLGGKPAMREVVNAMQSVCSQWK